MGKKDTFTSLTSNAALDEIDPLLAEQSWLSVNGLRRDPRWDPIREHPRFKGLLAKYSKGKAL